MLHSLLETVRSTLGHVPLPLWLSTALLAALIALFIERRTITRALVWGVIALLLWLVIYFA